MKKINYFKFGLDLLMGVTFVLLFNKRVIAGLTFHEIAGIVIGVAFITHILLNWRWVKNVTLKIFDRKLPGLTRFGYILNILLLIFMSFIIISGIFISRVVFPNLHVGNERWFQMTHISVSFLTLLIVGIHLGLHWKWVMNVWNRMLSIKKQKAARAGILLKVVAAAVFLFGAYEISQTGYFSRVASTANLFTQNSQQMPEGGKDRFDEGTHSMENPPTGNFSNGQKPTPPRGFKQGFHQDGDREGGDGGSNILSVLSTYFGIMSVFIILTYYLEKLGLRRKKSARA